MFILVLWKKGRVEKGPWQKHVHKMGCKTLYQD